MEWLRVVWALSFVVAASVVPWASSVAAQDPESLELLGDGDFVCESMTACALGTTMSSCESPEVCGQVGTDTEPGPRCHLRYHSFVCCDPEHPAGNGQCKMHNSAGSLIAEGACLAVELEGSSDVVGVCSFPSISATPSTLCVHADGDPTPWLEPCMTAPSPEPGNEGEPVEDWRDGDCDEDGSTNGAESDQGCNPCDAAEFLVDGACAVNSMPDAGPDGGRDAAVLLDAARDTSGPSPVGPDFRGSGGCACRAADGIPLDVGALPLLAVLWLGFRSSRRAGRGF